MEHKTYNIKTIYVLLISFVLLILVDQASKYIARFHSGFYVCNPNIAFGIPIPEVLFWIFWIGIIGIIFWALYRELRRHLMSKETSNVQSIALMFILAGAFSNAIDRMTLGCVVDFIDWKIWPVFNLADIFIVSGFFLWTWRFPWKKA